MMPAACTKLAAMLFRASILSLLAPSLSSFRTGIVVAQTKWAVRVTPTVHAVIEVDNLKPDLFKSDKIRDLPATQGADHAQVRALSLLTTVSATSSRRFSSRLAASVSCTTITPPAIAPFSPRIGAPESPSQRFEPSANWHSSSS
jgi:hypothetical protein